MLGFKRKTSINHKEAGWISLPATTPLPAEHHTNKPKQNPPSLQERIIKTSARTIGPSTSSILQEIEETETVATARTPTIFISTTPKPRLTPTITGMVSRVEGIRGSKPPQPQPTLQFQTPPYSNISKIGRPSSTATTKKEDSTINSQEPTLHTPTTKNWFHTILNNITAIFSRYLHPILNQERHTPQLTEDSFVNLPFLEEQKDIRPGVHTLKIEEGSDLHEALGLLRSKPSVILLDISAIRHDTELLRRIIKKIKHTQDAISGDLVGLGDSWIIATTKGISVERKPLATKPHNPYTETKPSRPSHRDWNNFESWNAERKQQLQKPLETY